MHARADTHLMRVLGIDPGLRLTGYGCVATAPQPRRGTIASLAPRGGVSVIEAGVFRLNVKASVSDRLVELESDLTELIARVQPDLVAVEQLYAHYAHPATAIVMGHARGVILLCIAKARLPLVELRPTEVKKAATGHGGAGKAQMQRAMQAELGLSELPKPPDVADALAIALCGLRRESVSARVRVTKTT